MGLLSMLATTAAASFLALLAFRVLVLGETALPVMPPATTLKLRLMALMSPGTISVRARAYLIVRTVQYMLYQFVYTLMWTIDDVFFSYRSVKIESPVFIVGGFRTGSTTLHRVLALDEERYVSPRFLELAFPFLCLQYLLDVFEWMDGKVGTKVIAKLEAALMAAAGPDVLARHPMSYYAAEEDDVLLATSHWTGYYVITTFPFTKQWVKMGSIGTYPKHEQQHIVNLYKRSLQKVLYRRGGGKTLLSKSHLIDMMALFDEDKDIVNPQFLDIVRHPKDVFVSWVALCDAGAKMMAGWAPPNEEAVPAHLEFWKAYYKTECDFFLPEGKAKNRTVVRFRPFVKNQLTSMKTVYEKWGLPFEGTAYQKRLAAEEDLGKNYKSKQKYVNPTLEELGISENIINTTYADYVKQMGLGA